VILTAVDRRVWDRGVRVSADADWLRAELFPVPPAPGAPGRRTGTDTSLCRVLRITALPERARALATAAGDGLLNARVEIWLSNGQHLHVDVSAYMNQRTVAVP
jgi:hypothetical protein